MENDRTIYSGHVRLVARPYCGKEWDVVISKNACAVLYIDDRDDVWLVKQHRVPLQKELLEVPAETIDKPGKSSLDVVIEGLEEECGVVVHRNQVEYVLSLYLTPGHDTEKIDLYIAKGQHQQAQQRLGPDEKIEVVKMPFNKAREMLLKGEIWDAKTAILLLYETARRS